VSIFQTVAYLSREGSFGVARLILYEKSTCTVHRRLVQGLLLQVHLL